MTWHEHVSRTKSSSSRAPARASVARWRSSWPARAPASPCPTSTRRASTKRCSSLPRDRGAQLRARRLAAAQAVFAHADDVKRDFGSRPLRDQQRRCHDGRHDRAPDHRGNRVAARHQPVGRDLRHQGIPAQDAGAARGSSSTSRACSAWSASRRRAPTTSRSSACAASPSVCGANSKAPACGDLRAPGRHQDQHRARRAAGARPPAPRKRDARRWPTRCC